MLEFFSSCQSSEVYNRQQSDSQQNYEVISQLVANKYFAIP